MIGRGAEAPLTGYSFSIQQVDAAGTSRDVIEGIVVSLLGFVLHALRHVGRFIIIPAWDYEQVCRELDNGFRYRYPAGETSSNRMVGLLFAPRETRLARDEIVPSLDYFHHRSGNNIDFFCAGYSRFGFTSGERPVTQDDPPWMFSIEAFDSFRRDIEGHSRWRYSSEADLLLMNGKRGNADGSASLDFSSSIVCDLDRMIRDHAIHSARRFFEDVFRFAEGVEKPDPTWGFSDEMGARTAGSALKRVILSLLPRDLGTDYQRAEHFAVRDVSCAS